MKRSFTLSELFVVIAILAILAALQLPGLGKDLIIATRARLGPQCVDWASTTPISNFFDRSPRHHSNLPQLTETKGRTNRPA